MSKYIIEIAEEYEEYFKGVLICGIADGKFAVDVIAREDLEELNSDYINEHFGSLQDEAYQHGLEDGKKYTEKGCDGCMYEEQKEGASPCCECARVCDDHYIPKRSDHVEVGDIVEVYGNIGVVTYMDELMACVMMVEDGSSGNWNLSECKKTGKHYDIQSILEAMRK